MAKTKTLILLFLAVLGMNVHASEQIFGPIRFWVPDTWSCQIAQENFICLDDSSKANRNTAIVVNYKQKSPQDSFSVYKDQLSRPRPLRQDELSFMSQPKGVQELSINDHMWIEGIHLGSEIPDYYTHYYATATNSYAILVSVSAHHSTYTSAMSFLKKTIFSFKLKKDFIIPGTNGAAKSVEREFGQNISRSKKIMVFGHSIPKVHFYLALGGLLVLGLLGYAILSE